MTTLLRRYLAQRTFSAAQRRQLAAEGRALPDGSYPIPDADALGRAAALAKSGHGDVAAAKRLIAKRARELGVKNPLDDMPVTQDAPDDGPATTSPGSSGVMVACPTCGVSLRAGVLSPDDGTTKKKHVAQAIFQMDAVQRVMKAVIQAPDLPHVLMLGGELVELTYTPEAVQQMCWDWMADGYQDRISIDHQEITPGGGIEPPHGEIATMVESSIAPVCMDVGDRHISQGSWIGAFQFHDQAVWDSVLAGTRTAPSLTAPLSQVEFDDIGA